MTATYTVDGMGKRVRKFDSTGAASTVVFVGFGPSVRGQAAVGINPDGSMSSVGGVKGHGGGGYGVGGGLDICYSWVDCTKCE